MSQPSQGGSTVHNRELVRLLRGWTAAAEDADLSTQQARTFRRAASSLASYTEPVTTREGARLAAPAQPPTRLAPTLAVPFGGRRGAARQVYR